MAKKPMKSAAKPSFGKKAAPSASSKKPARTAAPPVNAAKAARKERLKDVAI